MENLIDWLRDCYELLVVVGGPVAALLAFALACAIAAALIGRRVR